MGPLLNFIIKLVESLSLISHNTPNYRPLFTMTLGSLQASLHIIFFKLTPLKICIFVSKCASPPSVFNIGG